MSATPANYYIKCGRCGVVFPTHDCLKLDHFSIYRVVCPHCRWPGRYLASELHANPPAQLPSSPRSGSKSVKFTA